MADPGQELRQLLEREVRGEVRFDELSRTLYATDASIYEITPVGVLIPRDTTDVQAAVRVCAKLGVSITPRGAGTGLTGGAVGPGLQIDFSKHFDRVSELDVPARRVRVGPGVVLDRLNAGLAAHGLWFAPDVATSNRATLGGMIANNSCGARSLVYGRTVDHIVELTCVLADGSLVTWSADGPNPTDNGLAGRAVGTLGAIRSRHADEIARRYPKVMRSNGGYGLDRLVAAGEEVQPITVVSGSEGTLCLVVDAVLALAEPPKCNGLVVLEYGSVLDALGAVPTLLEQRPDAIELVDRTILVAARKADPQAVSGFVQGEPEAMLVVEMTGDAPAALADRLAGVERAARSEAGADAATVVTDPTGQAAVWNARKRGLGLLMSRPGDDQPYGFIEDTAVEAKHLREYIGRLDEALLQHGVNEIAHYAHASVGCIHVRPVLNLKKHEDVERMHAIAESVSDLVLEYGGAMTAEHGDGLVRSSFIEKTYGPELTAAFREIKTAFDPDNVFNPGKIVDPWPMTENLRYGGGHESVDVRTHLDFSAYGGLAGLAQMCSGVGQCRQTGVGTMCPSYVATKDEQHTTRARANAIRIALSNRGLLEGLEDPRLAEVMDLCLACKACKSECPTGVDLARIKTEWLAYRNRHQGVPRRSRLIADTPRLAAVGAQFAPLSNWVMRSRLFRALLEKRYGLDRRIDPPRFVRGTFRRWFRRHVKQRRRQNGPDAVGRAPRGRVVYFVDCWTNYYRPEVGRAAVQLLEAAGFDVLAPELQCCGRPMISKGLLSDATCLAQLNVDRLASLAAAGVPIVGTEPSCILTLADEYPQLVRTIEARQVGEVACTVETLLASVLREDPGALPFSDRPRRILYHGHCHQKALVGTADAMALLNAPPGYEATEIPSGCCGMAGSFGHEIEHYEVSKAIGEERLFPVIRGRDGAEVAISGFSCREQIDHHTDADARHVVEYVAEALKR